MMRALKIRFTPTVAKVLYAWADPPGIRDPEMDFWRRVGTVAFERHSLEFLFGPSPEGRRHARAVYEAGRSALAAGRLINEDEDRPLGEPTKRRIREIMATLEDLADPPVVERLGRLGT